ncbi:MAG: DUF2461 domain-containing protein [Bacteroidales bacterium]|nr:DUF2461 domain-containing protein [Tenuifilaceae bacterium]
MYALKPETFAFLSDLKDNNNREWFTSNKGRYEQAKENFSEFIQSLITELALIDPFIGLVSPKECIFRIFRDLRFATDKSPYKTNMGAYIAKGGRKSQWAGYYFHLAPNGSFVSGGLYRPQGKIIKSIREDMDFYSDDFLKIVTNPNFTETFTTLGSNFLKKVPTGFSDTSDVAHYLKLKQITPTHMLSDSDVLSQNLMSKVLLSFTQMQPLIAFINRAIEAAYTE